MTTQEEWTRKMQRSYAFAQVGSQGQGEITPDEAGEREWVQAAQFAHAVAGVQPEPTPGYTVALVLGVTSGEAIVDGGPTGGVRAELHDDADAPIPASELVRVDWGDGNIDVGQWIDDEGGFVAHIYREVASGVAITMSAADGSTATSETFDVVEA